MDLDTSNYFCCHQSCYNLLTVEDILTCRLLQRSVYSNRRQNKQFILNHLISNKMSDGSVDFNVGGSRICRKAWLRCHGLSESLFKKALALWKKGCTSAHRLPAATSRLRCKSAETVGWMFNYFSRSSERSPNGTQWYLPCCVTKKTIYNLYKETRASKVSFSQFCQLWLDHFHHVSIPKQSRFSKCDLCSAILDEKQKTASYLEKIRLDDLAHRHNQLQMNERMDYYKRVDAAISYPAEYLSIIIDSMDQQKLLIPRLAQQRKSTADCWLLRTHLIAAIVHGVTIAGAFDLFQYPHDSNLTCNFLMNILCQLTFLPKKLYLQLDNCWRENKNKYLLGFLAVLIHRRVFDQVYVYFLMKGHTHEDIDQLFSQYSNDFLSNNNILTLDDLVSRWEKCSSRQKKSSTYSPLVYVNKSMFDIKTWLSPCLSDMHGHTGPHAFFICRDADNTVVLKYKKWSSTGDDWSPQAGLPVLTSEPSGAPKMLIPSGEKIQIPIVKSSTLKIINEPSVRIFNEHDKLWWENFWQTFDATYLDYEQAGDTFPLDLLASNNQEPMDADDYSIPEDLASLQQRIDSPSVEVFVGHKSTSSRRVIDVDEIRLEVGQMVAIFEREIYNKFRHVPLIGQISKLVVSDDVNWVYVELWQGSYSTDWVRPKKPATECVTASAVILFDFRLTPKRHLPADTVKRLKALYDDYLKN